MKSFVRPENASSVQRPLVAACAAGLLTLGLAAGVWAGTVPAGVIGGQGGTTGSSFGGAAGNGGGGGNTNAAGSTGAGGVGGAGSADSSGTSTGGSGGSYGLNATMNSTVTGATGASGGAGNSVVGFNGGGGGGGGDGVYASSGITLTIPSGHTVSGGAGGPGGSAPNYHGGSGGGGGNGVEFAGTGTLVNQGVINGGTGGSGGATYKTYTGPGGGGGGHGVVGAGIAIMNSGTIAGGAAGNGNTGGSNGTAGDAILFTGGLNALYLMTGSTISGTIELATGEFSIVPKNSGLTLSSNIVMDGSSDYMSFETSSAGITVSGTVSGGDAVHVNGAVGNPVILTGANTFMGGTDVYAGDLQVDGSIGAVTIGAGVLEGVGTVGNITANGGNVAPGESSQMFGTLASNGTANLATNSTLSIRTTDGTACSALQASSALTLAGTLDIHFGNTPKVGAICTIATVGSVNGTFAKVISAPATVMVTYNPNNIQFTVTGNSDSIFADGFDGGAL